VCLQTVSNTSYATMLFTQFFDVRRADFWPMAIHHLMTIGLITFSYICNYVRIGALVLLCHDISDFFLEGAKLFKYAGYQLPADIGFGGFALTWFVFRLLILPFYVVHGSWFNGQEEVGNYQSKTFLHGMLVTLIGLHVWWFYLILRVIYNKIVLDLEVRAS
jgi:hypothetical protein